MNKYYSLETDSLSSATEIAAVLNDFGFHKGRYIAAIPKSFVRTLFTVTESLPDIEKKRARLLIEKNKKSIISLGLSYDSNLSWLENCSRFLSDGMLHGILTNQSLDIQNIFTIDDVIDGNLPDSDSIKTYATAENLVNYLEAVVRSSQEVYVVDPYFSLGKAKYISFLQKLIQHKESSGVNFVIFSKTEHFITKEKFSDLAKRHLQNVMQLGCKLSFYPLAELEDMHGRYAFSIHGGVTYDKGFQVTDDTLVDLSVMPKVLHNRYFDDYNGIVRRVKASYWCTATDVFES